LSREAKGKDEKNKRIKEMKTKTQQIGSPWDAEAIKDLEIFIIDLLGKNLADKYLTFRKDESEARTHYFETISTHNRNMTFILIIFLSAVVAFMSYLTVLGLVSGDALLFLIGTITGYVLLFIQRLVFPREEKPPAKEETT